MLFVLGFVIGGLVGIFAFAFDQVGVDKDSAKEGMVKLNGKFYKLVPMNQWEDDLK